MSQISIWIILSLFTSIAFSLWAIPRKFAKDSDIWSYNVYNWIWLFIFGLIYYLIFFESVSFVWNIELISYALFSWFFLWIWVIIFTKSVDLIWIWVANAIKNSQPIFAYIFWIIFLWEASSTNSILVFIWALLIVCSWFVLNNASIEEYSKNKKYLYLPFIAWIFLPLWIMFQSMANELPLWLLLIIIAIWELIPFSIYKLFTKKSTINNKWRLMWLLVWLIVLFCYLWLYYSFKNIEYSIWYSIVNLNTLWVILISFLFFKELNWKDYKFKILISMILSIIAIYMFYLSKI